MPELNESSLKKLDGIKPIFAKVITIAVKDCLIPFSVVQGIRTAEYQNELYQQGRTLPGKIVTNCDGFNNKSNHQLKDDGFGYAIDFCPIVHGILDWDNIDNFKIVANHIVDVGEKYGIRIIWGGNWNSLKDYGHLEYNGILQKYDTNKQDEGTW